MTDDTIDDLVSGAAKAHDADFGSLAIYAALKAATEDRIHMTDNLIDDRPDVSEAPPDRPYIDRRRRHVPPPIQRRFLAAVAAVAFIATCAAGVALSRDDDEPREPDKANTTTVPEGVLEERIIAANREAYANSIVHRTLTYENSVSPEEPDSTHDSWTDDRTGASRWRSSGMEEGFEPRPELVALDLGPVTYDGVDPVGIRTVDSCSSEYSDDLSAPSHGAPNALADFMVESLEDGGLVVDGTEVFRGRDAIRLRIAQPDPRSGFIWLDATTLLPFWSEGSADSDGDFTEAFVFLPRSEENIDLLVPPVPAGFTKVAKVPDRGAVLPTDCPQ
jgi:hypothetical protein